jgi:hypothetical protein
VLVGAELVDGVVIGVALDGEAFVCACGAGVGADCSGVAGGCAPAVTAALGVVPLALFPAGASLGAVCASAALLAANRARVTSSPAATQADRRCVLSVFMGATSVRSRGNTSASAVFPRRIGAG